MTFNLAAFHSAAFHSAAFHSAAFHSLPHSCTGAALLRPMSAGCNQTSVGARRAAPFRDRNRQQPRSLLPRQKSAVILNAMKDLRRKPHLNLIRHPP
jgi:hypothetical protein